MDFQQNQITRATTKTGFNGNNYNRRRNLFRLVFSERRSHEEEKQISYQQVIWSSVTAAAATVAAVVAIDQNRCYATKNSTLFLRIYY